MTKEKKPKLNIPTPKDMLDAGVHLGHQARRWSPKMSPYIFDKRRGVHVIDLFITEKKLKEACEFLYEVAQKGGKIIFVGTKRQVSDIIKSEAERSSGLFVEDRWLGGTLTNYKQIKKSIDMLATLKKKLESGEFDHYTKKERLEIERKIKKLNRSVGGIANLSKTPEALFIVDAKREKTAVREARRLGIPIVALTDTNTDPEGIDYVIPGNDDSIKSLILMVGTVADAIEKGYKEQSKKPADTEALKAEEPQKKTEAKKIEETDLGNRSKNALIKAGYTTVTKVKKLKEEDLGKIKGLGKKSIEEILKFNKN